MRYQRSVILDRERNTPSNPRGLLTDAHGPPVRDDDGAGDGITLTYVGDGVWALFLPAGSGGHATQLDGPTFKWPMRSWVDGKVFTWPGNRYNGQLQFRLESVTDPQAPAVKGTDVQVTLGHAGAGDGADGMFGGLAYEDPVELCGFRVASTAISNSVRDTTPSDAISQAVWYGDVSIDTFGLEPSNSGLAGLTAAGESPVGPSDFTTVFGFIDAQDHIALNVFAPTVIASDTTILIRPRAWCSLHDLS